MVAALLVLVYHPWPAFEMDMLYVGQGDGIFISSRGRHFLIDGGSSTKEKLAKYTLLPFLHSKGVGRLDGIFLTHDDTDHCSCLLEFLEAAAEEKPLILINAVYLPDIAEAAKGENYRRIELLSGQVGIPVHYISRGQRIRSGNLTLDCLHPAKGASYEDANEYSTTLLLRYGDSSQLISDDSDIASRLSEKEKGFSVLYTGDLEGQGEEDLLHYLAEINLLKTQDGLLNIDVLKVAHHGSKNATSSKFLQAVHPDMVMISAGIDNMYKHPSEELLNRLAISIPDSSVYRTDLQGEITICHKKGGDDYRVKTFLGGTAETLAVSRRSLESEAIGSPKK
jgi:competence protein ComEC